VISVENRKIFPHRVIYAPTDGGSPGNWASVHRV